MLAPVAESVDGAPQLDAPVLTELILQRPNRGGDLHRGQDRMPRARHLHIIWGVTLLVDGRYQEGTTGRDVYESQEVH